MQKTKPIPYTIEIPQNSNYPFNLSKNIKFKVLVKVKIAFTQPRQQFHRKIKRLIDVNCDEVIGIKQVIQTYTQQNYTLLYQYIPYSITYQSQFFEAYIKQKKYYKCLKNLFINLVQQGIRPYPKLQDFGLNQNGQLKYFLKSQFKMLDLTLPRQIKNALVNSLLQKCQKEFEKIQYIGYFKSQKNIKTKIQNIQDKIRKIKNNFDKIKQKQLNNNLQTKKQSSQQSQPNKKAPSNQIKANSGFSLQQNQRNFDQSYSYRQTTKRVKRRTSSFKIIQKKSKSQHKMSWQGSQTIPKQESDKATVLKNRISQALIKTQLTLTKYEKAKKRWKSLRRIN